MMQKTAAEMLAELLKDCGVSQRKRSEERRVGKEYLTKC